MSPSTIAVAVLLLLVTCAPAQAQEAPLRGIGLLALNSSDTQAPAGARQTLVESPDGGGGSLPRNGRGAGDIGPAARRSHDDDARRPVLPDALPPPETAPHADPSTPAATPKRPSYRWQSLVPGAIK